MKSLRLSNERLVITFLAAIAVELHVGCSETASARLRAADFLGPVPGTHYLYKGSEGVRMKVVASEHPSPTAIRLQETVTVEVGGETATTVGQYELVVEGGQLLRRKDGATVTLLKEPIEADTSTWSVESELVGGGGLGATTLVSNCSVASVRPVKIDGTSRPGVLVECVADAEIAMEAGSPAGSQKIVTAREFVESLGLVREEVSWIVPGGETVLTSYKLMSINGTEVEISADEAEFASSARASNGNVLDAVFAGDLERMKSLILAGEDVDVRGVDGITPLMVAAESNRIDLMRGLIAAGADVDARAANGGTAIIVAAMRQNIEAARILVESGADLDLRIRHDDYDGLTALEIAQELGNTALVDLLRVK